MNGKFHDFLTLLMSTEKLFTGVGFELGLSNPLVLHFRIFGSIFSEYSVIRRIWAWFNKWAWS